MPKTKLNEFKEISRTGYRSAGRYVKIFDMTSGILRMSPVGEKQTNLAQSEPSAFKLLAVMNSQR